MFVSESGVAPSTLATENVWAECPATAATLTDCQAIEYWFGPGPALSLSIPVYRRIFTSGGTPTDCAVVQCVVAAARMDSGALLATVAISFKNTVTCARGRTCETTGTAAATALAPGLAVNVTGAPATGSGTVKVSVSSGTLACPQVGSQVRPVADLTDTGFKPSDHLRVIATLSLASSTSAEQVCFHSSAPFRSQSNPTTAKPGTAFLLTCSQVSNQPPCVQSSKQLGSDVVVTFIVAGGDPTFTIVTPHGKELWASKLGQGTVGKAYSAHFQTRGGIVPVTWKISHGHLPRGCTLDPKTGAISGTPAAKGSYPIVVQAMDSERPPKIATLPVPINVD